MTLLCLLAIYASFLVSPEIANSVQNYNFFFNPAIAVLDFVLFRFQKKNATLYLYTQHTYADYLTTNWLPLRLIIINLQFSQLLFVHFKVDINILKSYFEQLLLVLPIISHTYELSNKANTDFK